MRSAAGAGSFHPVLANSGTGAAPLYGSKLSMVGGLLDLQPEVG